MGFFVHGVLQFASLTNRRQVFNNPSSDRYDRCKIFGLLTNDQSAACSIGLTIRRQSEAVAKEFFFDKVFGKEASQGEVFQEVEDLVQSSLD